MAQVNLGTPSFELHPLHGVHEPTVGTRRRHPCSVRRTTSVDMTRRPGCLDPLYLEGRARDVFTDETGALHVLAETRLDAIFELTSGHVARIESEPAHPALDGLVGAPARSGFRAAVDRVDATLRQRGGPLYALLDDLPVAALISGHALAAAGLLGDPSRAGYMPLADQCSGFVTGGLLMNAFEAGQTTITTGPAAPSLEAEDDTAGWHAMPPLPVHGMRRRRRLDICRQGDLLIDAMFRDTYVRADDVETIIHEYTITARVREDGTVVEAEAVPRVLPWMECPGAVASARRIVGMPLSEVRSRVRAELKGTATCTHLNDLLRSLGDVTALIPQLDCGIAGKFDA